MSYALQCMLQRCAVTNASFSKCISCICKSFIPLIFLIHVYSKCIRIIMYLSAGRDLMDDDGIRTTTIIVTN